MYFLLEKVNFQPAMLVYWRVKYPFSHKAFFLGWVGPEVGVQNPT